MNKQIPPEEIALFRYSILAPLISGTFDLSKGKKAFFREASSHTYLNPNGVATTFSAATIERWYYNYIRKGLEGLTPKRRVDSGRSRKLDDDVMDQIKYLKEEYPRIPATLIYQRLYDNGTIDKGEISLSTINRFVNKLKLDKGYTNNKDMRRYERSHINEVCYGDSSVGPYLKVDGKKKRVWIIAMIDDASRLITGIDLFFNDNKENVMSVMKSSISKFGLSKRYVYDNGSSYKNNQIKLLAARIGTVIQYCTPYTPVEKSKIERFFKSLKQQWMSQLNMNDFNTLDELRASLMTYIQIYNQKTHSSLNESPMDRFYKESHLIKRLDSDFIEKNFLLETERRVSADNVININKKEYEVHYRYSKQRITLRYSPDMETVYLVDKHSGELTPIQLLDKHANAEIKREKVKLTGGDI